jgi:hypothetical protein
MDLKELGGNCLPALSFPAYPFKIQVNSVLFLDINFRHSFRYAVILHIYCGINFISQLFQVRKRAADENFTFVGDLQDNVTITFSSDRKLSLL